MTFEDSENPAVLPSEFQQAAEPAAALIEPPKVMVTLPLSADVLAYLQGESEPSNWQRVIDDLLRHYMDTNLMMEADIEMMAQQTGPQPQP